MAAILPQVGQFYFGAVGQYYFGVNTFAAATLMVSQPVPMGTVRMQADPR